MSSSPASTYGGIAVRIAVLAALTIASYRSVVLAWADLEFRKATPPALEEAERLMPANAQYHYTRALILQQNDPASPEIQREFARAVAINPRYSDALMAWSVEREMHGDQTGSEQLLLKAQRLDHLVRPAWALANFYYRQGDTQRFLENAHETLRIIGVSGLSEGRFAIVPIYELCWKSGADAQTILEKAIPDIPDILGEYLRYVLFAGHRSAAPAVVARMIPTSQPREIYFLRPYLEDLLVHNQVALAAKTWKRLYEKEIVPYRGPDVEKGVFLTNGALAGAPLDYGFDWRRAFPDSIQFNYSLLEHTYRFDFDGTEPEHFGLVVQVVPLLPDREYRFQSRFESDTNPDQSGLTWAVHDHKTGQPLKIVNSIAPDKDATMLTMRFRTPPNMDSGDLTLSYMRQPGTTRLHGFYRLLHADLQQTNTN